MFRQVDADLTGKFVISKAGHDAGECYVVVSAAGNYLFIANGKNRTIQKPKKKNRVHLFVTKQAVPDIGLLLKEKPEAGNTRLASYIKTFRKESE